jgi:flagellum-specific peptidoglycan hydrolase FlgJ
MKNVHLLPRYLSRTIINFVSSGVSFVLELFPLIFVLFPVFLSETLELMFRVKVVYFFMAANVLFVSCRSTRTISNSESTPSNAVVSDNNNNAVASFPKMPKAARVAKTGDPAVDYINAYRDIAIHEMKRTGVPASITLAQGMLESDFGRSELARRGNNHFGIKCHNWNGASVYHNDDRRNDCFRKYGSAEESFQDHSDFIAKGSRYSSLFDLSPYDYKAWATGLKRAGYATNPNYAALLVRKIEENDLYIYDKEYTAGKQAKIVPVSSVPEVAVSEESRSVIARTPRIMENNRIQYIIVKDGDTREKIEEEFKLLRWELQRYNDLGEDFSLLPGQILYLQPKREKAEAGKDQYTYKEGDTMYQLSQKFGIKLKSLYALNRMEEGIEPKPGTKLWLRSMKPVN